jgi:uncharacterized membrane protein
MCLLSVMIGALYTHLMINDPFERIAPALIFTMLLVCRLIIFYQTKRSQLVVVEATYELFENESKIDQIEKDKKSKKNEYLKNNFDSKLFENKQDLDEKKLR